MAVILGSFLIALSVSLAVREFAPALLKIAAAINRLSGKIDETASNEDDEG